MNETAQSVLLANSLDSKRSACRIRPAALDDVDSIYSIETISFRSPWSRSAFPAEIEGRSWSRVEVAECEGALVGFMVYWIILDEVHLLNLAVLPKWRRRGIGRSLMINLLDMAESDGQNEVLLEVRQSNTKAQNLYYSLGFEQLGLRRNYYSDNGEDALVMIFKLNNGAQKRV